MASPSTAPEQHAQLVRELAELPDGKWPGPEARWQSSCCRRILLRAGLPKVVSEVMATVTEDPPKLTLTVRLEREVDGRWMAIVPSLSGVMVYGKTREEAVRLVLAMALRVIADELEAGERDEMPVLAFDYAA